MDESVPKAIIAVVGTRIFQRFAVDTQIRYEYNTIHEQWWNFNSHRGFFKRFIMLIAYGIQDDKL